MTSDQPRGADSMVRNSDLERSALIPLDVEVMPSGSLVLVTDDFPSYEIARMSNGLRADAANAYAALFKAAPDLLEALQAVDAFASAPASLSADHDAVLLKVRAAISRATQPTKGVE